VEQQRLVVLDQEMVELPDARPEVVQRADISIPGLSGST
jgi:hypothetical protein